MAMASPPGPEDRLVGAGIGGHRPGPDHDLAEAVQIEVAAEAAVVGDQGGEGRGLGLGERGGAMVVARRRPVARPLGAEAGVPVAVEVDPEAPVGVGAPVLAPQPIGGPRVAVAVGVRDGHHRHVPPREDRFRVRIGIVEERLGEVHRRAGRAPLPRVQAAVDQDALAIGVQLVGGDPQAPQGPSLDRGAQRDRGRAGVVLGQGQEVIVELLEGAPRIVEVALRSPVGDHRC